jgi:cytochrome P450 family 3 subfamily A
MLAGFDTTATTLTSTCFQLAKNPDVQEKLFESIMTQMQDYVSLLQPPKVLSFLINLATRKKDEVSHEMVQNVPYLEMVIQEVLRCYPPLLR